MADPVTILKSLKLLQEYYRHDYNQTQVEVLTRQLRPIPNGLLRQAVETYMALEGRWLPKVSQLVSLAKQISGYRNFESIPEGAYEPSLGSKLQSLKNQAYGEGVIDHKAWQKLEKEAEHRDQVHALEAIRRAYQALLTPQTREECLSYQSWEQPDPDNPVVEDTGPHPQVETIPHPPIQTQIP